jgi:TonB family protein
VLVHRVEAKQRPLGEPVKAIGPVVLEFVVETDGTVGSVRVVRSTHPIVDAAWVDAVKKWRYRPGSLNGKAIRWPTTVVVNAHPENWPRKNGGNGAAG